MTISRIIYATLNHPLFEQLSLLEGFSQEVPENCDKLLFDFSATSTDSKIKLFQDYSGPIISDLSLNNGDQLTSNFPQIAGAMATVFPSPKKTYEVFIKNQEVKNQIDIIFNQLEIKMIEVTKPGIGFIFPRTMVQIINEAWFALEDNLATEQAIDTAMLFGVNYPKGPLSWGKEAGLINTTLLLEELYKETKQKRYLVSQKLKEASL